MPFRIPFNYKTAQVCAEPAKPQELTEYLHWLRGEQRLVQEALAVLARPEATFRKCSEKPCQFEAVNGCDKGRCPEHCDDKCETQCSRADGESEDC